MKVQFTFLLKELNAMTLFTSRDESRYVLNGIYTQVDCEGAYARAMFVATDGRRLAALRGEQVRALPTAHERATFIIPNVLLDCLPVSTPLRATRDEEEDEDDLPPVVNGEQEWSGEYNTDTKRIRLSDDTLTFEAESIKGNYPNFRQVVPSTEDKPRLLRMHVNPELLWSFQRAIKFLHPHRILGASTRQREELGPWEIVFESEPAFYGLLMPMRLAGDNPVVAQAPQWLVAA